MSSGYFQWDKDFLTGVETVDSQHYELVEMINELLKLSFLNEKIEHDIILDLENKLMHYVAIHFKTENDLMKQYGIDERHVRKHQLLHDDFIKTVTRYFDDKSALVDPNKLSEIIEYLVRWLAYHILNTDKSMARQIKYISEEGLSPEAAYDQDEKIT
ncbi:MAG TPA: hemerythrin domain-containing protein, partial [Fusibacter sp.]|nr:hemerythrin domain-containing protein [Fusibacter sp.]